jgi:maltose O-acetyltransferase
MISFFLTSLNKYLEKKNSKRVLNLIGKIGNNYKFIKGSNVILKYGSNKNDICIGERFLLRGTLYSQYGGKISIGKFSEVGKNTRIAAVNSVKIGDYVSITSNIIIIDNNNHPVQPDDRKIWQNSESGDKLRSWKYSVSKPIVIGNNVWIGENSRINKGVSIGNNSVIAANSVVTKDVPENSIAAGNPAKVVKTNIDQLPRIFDHKIE